MTDSADALEPEAVELDEATALERAIVATGEGRLPTQALLWVLAASDLLVGTDEEPGGTVEDLSPLVVSRDGQDLLAVFTRPGFAADFPDQARYLIPMPGLEALGRLPPGLGMVVNPGQGLGFELPAEGVLQIQEELGLGAGKA